ncbi:tryptophan-rich sensory protein [Streptomyces sp. NPDC059893]|uniref:tryptophan-rich sensory protein n=1 Tax=Streptomyces sp. NPDC059893 TaxID=3346990 RepID=UPI003661A16A
MGERQAPQHSRVPYLAGAVAVTAAAAAGSAAVDPDSSWYRRLSKPSRPPPAWAFGAVWAPRYASIAWAGGVMP